MNDESPFNKREQAAIAQTELWLKQVVIGYNFCPFASYPADKGLVRTVACFELSLLECAFFFKDEVIRLLDSSASELETTLLVFSDATFAELEDLLGFIDDMHQFLEENELADTFQLVGFHPSYQFEGEDINERSNFTNRSPFPMIHIIREESMSRAIEGYGEDRIDQIPEKNIAKLRTMSEAEFKEGVLRYCCASAHKS